MSGPDRKGVCLAQARAFQQRAETDPLNCDYWSNEATKWLERAAAPVGRVVITIEETIKIAPVD
jgi:hypothetical protein